MINRRMPNGYRPRKTCVEAALQQEQQGIKPVKNYAEAFKSRTVILFCLQYALWSIGVYGFVMWLPSIIKAAPQHGYCENRMAVFRSLCFGDHRHVNSLLFF